MVLKQIVTISFGFAACVGIAAAQNFPTRTIRAIVPYAPGGSTDVVMRILAPRMSEILGQQVIVENRPARRREFMRVFVTQNVPREIA